MAEMTSRERVDESLLPALWERKRNGDRKAEAEIVEMYLWRAKQLARAKKVPEQVSLDDLESWAMYGLFDAVRKFDPGMNIDGGFHKQFYAYASTRINGAILDGLKSPQTTWAPRQVWRRRVQQRETEERLAQALGRIPTVTEVAAEMGVEVSDLVDIRIQVPVGSTTFDGDPEDDQHGISSWVGDSDTPAEALTNVLAQRLAWALSQLPTEHQRTLSKVYLNYQPARKAAAAHQAAIEALVARLTQR